jgi:hypothetical protein
MSGLIGPAHRKSIQPMAEQLALGEYDQLHHFISAGVWGHCAMHFGNVVSARQMVIDNCPCFREPLLLCKSQDVIRLCSQKSRAWIYVHPPTGRVLDGVQGVSSILNIICVRFGHGFWVPF